MPIKTVAAAPAAILQRQLLRARVIATGVPFENKCGCLRSFRENVGICNVPTLDRSYLASLDIPIKRQRLRAFCFLSTQRFLSLSTASPFPHSSNSSSDKGESCDNTNSRKSSFFSVTDDSKHWMPRLAAALQQQGPAFARIAAAAKGDCMSADPVRIRQKAVTLIERWGYKIPHVAVVVFQAQWSASSTDLLRWLSDEFAGERQQNPHLELVSVCSDSAPQLLKVYDVASLPHCMLLVNGHVALGLPAGASVARREAFVAAVTAATSSARASIAKSDPSPRDFLLDQLEAAVKTKGFRDQTKIKMLLQKLKEEVSSPASHSGRQHRLPAATLRQRKLASQKLASHSATASHEKQQDREGSNLLESEERASRLAALATVALFDTPGETAENLRALHEALSRAAGSPQDSAETGASRRVPPLPATLHETLLKVLEIQEPQWSADDCPIIRRLPLFNQLTLNANMFAKARGAQPPLTGIAAVASSARGCLDAPHWQLVEWLSRTRRCLAARLFFESSEVAAIELAATSHGEWLAGASASNYMQLRMTGEKAETTANLPDTSGEGPVMTLEAKKPGQTTGVHPLNVWSEPRAPSPGRTLLSSMYTALGPDDPRVHQSLAKFDILVKAHEFHPTKFSHPSSHRGGKPRMMRGRSGRWFWLGPYWKPPWAPKKKSFVESWHLTNVAA